MQPVRPLLAVDPADPRVVVRELDPPLGGLTITLAWPRGRTLSPVAQRTVEIARAITAPRRSAATAASPGRPRRLPQPPADPR